MSTNRSTLTFVTGSLPAFTVGRPYDFDLDVSGGTLPYSFEVSEGTLPDGIRLSSTGKISGTPTQTGDSTAFVKLADAAGDHLTQAFDCQVS